MAAANRQGPSRLVTSADLESQIEEAQELINIGIQFQITAGVPSVIARRGMIYDATTGAISLLRTGLYMLQVTTYPAMTPDLTVEVHDASGATIWTTALNATHLSEWLTVSNASTIHMVGLTVGYTLVFGIMYLLPIP